MVSYDNLWCYGISWYVTVIYGKLLYGLESYGVMVCYSKLWCKGMSLCYGML
jgi:hypothetical protein